MVDARNDLELTDKLLAKISLQADELLCQKNDLMLKEGRILELETQLSKCGFTPPAAGTSDLAKRRKDEAKHRDQLNALQKQLDTANKRLRESGLVKNQLIVDLEHKVRECRFAEKQCEELQQENHKLIHRLEAVTFDEGSGSMKSPAALKARSQSLQGQLRAAKDALRLKEKELDEITRELEEGRMRISTLEKALEFRASEIGLSGHADLLAKVASFRGEVTALKKDLMDKRNKLHDIEAERQTVSESNLTLQQQVTQLQERLAQSRFELQRVQNGESLIEQLKQTENERDVLLEFIQEDLKKNTDLTLATDKAIKEASEATRNASAAQAQLKQQGELVDSQAQYIRDLEAGRATLQNDRAQAKEQLGVITRDLEDLRSRFNRKELEAQEQSRINMQMLEQLKNKEDIIINLTAELSASRIKLEGQEATNNRLQEERRSLEQQVKRLTEEVVPLREESLMSAVAANLRPEIESLQRDYNAALTEKRELLEEVQRLRFYDKQFQELRGELDKVKVATEALISPGGSVPPADVTMSASQRHVMWTGIPSLRQLSPVLYENIRALFQDLFNKEAECRDLAALVKRFKDDQSYREEDYRHDYQKMADLEEQMHRRTAEDRACIDAMDRELVRSRTAKLVLEQIRLVLKSTLGSAVLDYIHGSRGSTSRSGTPATGGRFAAAGRHFRDPHEDELRGGGAYEFDDSFAIRRNDDAINTSLEAIANAEIHEEFGASIGFKANNGGEDVFGSISDESLPSILSQALARHMSAVADLEACERQLRDTTDERDHLSSEVARATAEVAGLKQRLSDIQETSEGKEHHYHDKYRKMEADLSMAVCLNEKQNALTITLEAKVEELKRHLSVQSAQVLSFQQQEQVFKHEILNIFGKFWRAVQNNHGSLDVSRENWFNQQRADENKIDLIIQSAAEILSAINGRLGSTRFQPSLSSAASPPLGLINTPGRSPHPSEVSHHYRHWQSGGVTKSPLTKMNQEYIERVSRGERNGGCGGSPSLLSRSLSQPFTRDEFRRSGGSKSFSGLDATEQRLSPPKSSSREHKETTRDNLPNNSEILNRLQKAKTAYSFMRSDSLVDFS